MSIETPAPPATAAAWALDPARSSVGFAIRHLRVATVRGRFETFTARLVAVPGGVRVEGRIDTASVESGDAIRDRRLREEFFRSDAHPSIVFTADAPPLLPGTEARVEGDLTIRGTTRRVVLTVTCEARDEDGTLRLRAQGDLRRSDFGLEWEALGLAGSRLVADRVRLVADVAAVPAHRQARTV